MADANGLTLFKGRCRSYLVGQIWFGGGRQGGRSSKSRTARAGSVVGRVGGEGSCSTSQLDNRCGRASKLLTNSIVATDAKLDACCTSRLS